MKQEQVTLADLRMQAKPACSNCGSSNIWAEAFARWNERKQCWEVADLLDGNTVCNHCGQQTEIKWKLEK